MKTWTIGELTPAQWTQAERIARTVTRSRIARSWLLDVVDGREAISGSTLSSSMKRKIRYASHLSAQFISGLRDAGIVVREATKDELVAVGMRVNARVLVFGETQDPTRPSDD